MPKKLRHPVLPALTDVLLGEISTCVVKIICLEVPEDLIT